MPLPKKRILYLMDRDEITISPYEDQYLQEYGYEVHLNNQVMLAEIENGINTTIDANGSMKYTTYDIPDTGFVLDPTKLYYFPLKETIESTNWAIEIVPNPTLVSAGLNIGLSVTPIPGIEFTTTIYVTVNQPLKIYRDYNIALARFTLVDDNGGVTSGMIVAYSGSEIPYGWLLCDGSNGTPDLRDRFILGSEMSGIGQTGGLPENVLEVANLPNHSHPMGISLMNAGMAAAVLLSDGETSDSAVTALAPYSDYLAVDAYETNNNAPGTPEGTEDGKYEIPLYKSGENNTVTINTSSGGGEGGGGEGTGGDAKPFTNLPPYYTLMFIMKE